ncbi:MAG: tyrosine--tRNA ligase [Pirellulaceae bacterium]
MTDIVADLSWRGLIHQCTDLPAVTEWLNTGSRTVYIGFDPTAGSMHVGNLVQLVVLRRFQRAGHRPIALVGGATGMIGDPSGKSAERNLLTAEVLESNVASMQLQMSRFLDFDSGDNAAQLVNNLDWIRDWTYLAFLRDVGKNFPVNVMLGKESVKNRLDRVDGGLSYTEFSYMLLQAYDFVHLSEQFDCHLQFGGSDQWGNITAGIDLARRLRGVQLYGITCPLLTKSDGSKMGKTESGSIWLSSEQTSPYKFYQYWMNVADDDAGSCLRMLTELSREEIEELDAVRQQEPHARASQRRLAEHLTELVHGDEGLSTAVRATEILFGAEIEDLDDGQLLDIFADVPSEEIDRQRLSDPCVVLIDAMVEVGLCSSKGEARRTIEQGGAYINNRRVETVEQQLTCSDLASQSVIVLRRGKKKYALLRCLGG